MAPGILDTSTLILLRRIEVTGTLPSEPLITQQAEADFDPLPFDAEAARSFGQVAASLRRAGRKPAARTCDAMIAAVCIANELPSHTCNADDFTGIDGLVVIAVAHPDR